jgi:pimeloyl-ACP methyl ester carboxylesterase
MWHPCDLRERGDGAAQCATVAVPLDHNSASSAQLELALKRVPSREPERRQLWFLDGGPGDAGRASLGRIAEIFSRESDLGLYTFDHRGVGGSSALRCPDQQADGSVEDWEIAPGEWTACMSWLRSNRPDLPFMTVSQAARDVALLIDRLGQDRVVFVWGVSYGTFLIWQYLHLHAEQPDGVIVDGIVPPDWSFAEFDAGLDRAGRAWLSLCQQSAECSQRMGEDPVGIVRAAAVSLEHGPCRGLGLTPELLRVVLGNLFMAGEPFRSLVPVVAHRARRCDWRDRAALIAMFNAVFESGAVGEDRTRHDPVAQRHLAMSALWHETDPPADSLERALQKTVLTTGVSAAFARTFPDWPRAGTQLARELPAYDGPMLMMHRALDPTMPLDRFADIRNRYMGPGQTFVVVPGTGHVGLNAGECPRAIYLSFLREPQRALDTSCTAAIRDEYVPIAKADANRLLGTADVWGDQRPGTIRTVLFATGWALAALAWGLAL